MTERTPEETLNSIESHTQIADFFQEADRYALEHAQADFMEHLDKRACSFFAHKFFEAKAFMRKEVGSDEAYRSRRFRWRMAVLMPQETHFTDRLEQAREEGRQEILFELEKHAARLEASKISDLAVMNAHCVRNFVKHIKEQDDERRRAEYDREQRARGAGGGAAS